MSKTLTYSDSITRTGYTTINGVKIMRHVCTISADNPDNMNVTSVKLDQQLYKENREICRADMAEFEDLAYQLQEKMAEKQNESPENLSKTK